MKYLKEFATESDVNMSVLPNVVLVSDTGKVLYNVQPSGVYIQHIDGELYTTDEWTARGFSNEEANGVAVGQGDISFVVSKEKGVSLQWCSDTENAVEGLAVISNAADAEKDYNGVANTALIAGIDTSGAANYCANYTFPNGAKGYLPAFGEVAILYANEQAVRKALALIGGDSLDNTLWSSTQGSANSAWLYRGAVGPFKTYKRSKSTAIAFTSCNI
jgi:hypothetical protein